MIYNKILIEDTKTSNFQEFIDELSLLVIDKRNDFDSNTLNTIFGLQLFNELIIISNQKNQFEDRKFKIEEINKYSISMYNRMSSALTKVRLGYDKDFYINNIEIGWRQFEVKR